MDTRCPECNGSGWDEEARNSRYTFESMEAACQGCDGTGLA